MITKFTKILLIVVLNLTSLSYLMAQTDSLARKEGDSVIQVPYAVKGPKVKITVLDGLTGSVLSGANVIVPDFSSAITNEAGSVNLVVPNEQAYVLVSLQGYETKEFYIKSRQTVAVKLFVDGSKSPFGMLTGALGVQAKSVIPYAVSSDKVYDSWKESSQVTPDNYLKGKISGLNAVRRSGTPGTGSNLMLRGYNSLYTNNQPLLVVDGMIYNNDDVKSLFNGFGNNALEQIDIKDIEEITVLKDAGAAIYGTRGANGVILITTRTPISESTKIDFAAYGSYNSQPSQLPVMQDADYRGYLSALLQSANLSSGEVSALSYFNNSAIGNPDFYKYQFNSNWQNEVLNNNYNQNYHLNVTGGDNIAKYNLSLGYVNNKGVIANSGLTRYFTRFNAAFDFTKKLSATANLSFSSTQHTLFNQGNAYHTSPLYLGLVKAPFMSPMEVGPSGEISPNFAFADVFGISNPGAIIDGMDAINTNYRVIASGTVKYKINKKLAIQTQLGIAYDKIRDRLFIPERGVATDSIQNAVIRNSLGTNTNRLFSVFNDSRISFSNLQQKHHIAANLGLRFKQDKYEGDYGLTYNSATDEYRSPSGGNSSLRDIGGNLSQMWWLNVYGNFDYSFQNKYFLSLNTAVDGSSRFGTTIPNVLTINGNKLAVMPSIGAAWLISSEKFLSNNSVVDLLKLRLSYGLVGNDDIGDYAAKPYYVSQNLYGQQGYVQGNIGNTNLKWETVEKLNLGLDVSLLGERINFSMDAYRHFTHDMLTYNQLSPEAGFAFAISNGGEMETKGIELGINGRIFNKTFKWDAGLIVSHYKNKIAKLESGRIETQFNGATVLTEVGLPANVFYGYKTNGVYATTEEATASNTFVNPSAGLILPVTAGDVRFVNRIDSQSDLQNGTHLIDGQDRQVIGDPNPDFTGMFSNNFQYKNWSLTANFTFSQGNDVYNGLRNRLEASSGYQNQLLSVNNRWRAEGQVTDQPKVMMGDPSQNSRFSDRWIEDGSYLRLQTLVLAYDFKIKNNAYLKTLKLYANASNVFTLSKYLGYDPEFSATRSILGQGVDTGLEPQFKTFQLGMRVGL